MLGLSFRPTPNDMRESPAIPLVKRLLAEGAQVSAFDPIATAEARHILGDAVHYCGSLEEALKDQDAVILVTRWKSSSGCPRC